MFSEYLLQFPWKDTTERIYSKTDEDVRRALLKRHYSGRTSLLLFPRRQTLILKRWHAKAVK